MKNKLFSLALIPLFAMCFLILSLIVLMGSRAVSVSLETKPLVNRHTIVIDAGHGGEDGGASSCTGFWESNINLEIALRLNDLMHLLGYQTAMVRTTDCALHTQGETIASRKASDLKERVKIANHTENCIWISIHQNYFTDERYRGAQVFYGNSVDSDTLGKQLQQNLIKTINPNSNRQAKKISGVYLFDHMTVTGVLIECGFLSNREEEALLRNVSYQKQLCGVIAATVGTFLS